MRARQPGLAIWSTPLTPHMSPAAIGCNVVRFRGWPSVSKRAPSAASVASGQPSPDDDDTVTTAPSGIRRAAAAAERMRGLATAVLKPRRRWWFHAPSAPLPTAAGGTATRRRSSRRPSRALAVELAELAGGPGALAERALKLLAVANESPEPAPGEAEAALRLAGHLAKHAWLAGAGRRGHAAGPPRGLRGPGPRATSTMARGVFNWAANEAGGASGGGAQPHGH